MLDFFSPIVNSVNYARLVAVNSAQKNRATAPFRRGQMKSKRARSTRPRTASRYTLPGSEVLQFGELTTRQISPRSKDMLANSREIPSPGGGRAC